MTGSYRLSVMGRIRKVKAYRKRIIDLTLNPQPNAIWWENSIPHLKSAIRFQLIQAQAELIKNRKQHMCSRIIKKLWKVL